MSTTEIRFTTNARIVQTAVNHFEEMKAFIETFEQHARLNHDDIGKWAVSGLAERARTLLAKLEDHSNG